MSNFSPDEIKTLRRNAGIMRRRLGVSVRLSAGRVMPIDRVALHEAAHAIVALALGCTPVALTASRVPRGIVNGGGFALFQYEPDIRSRDLAAVALAGN